MFIAEKHKKLQDLVQEIVMDTKKRGLQISCKKTVDTFVNKMKRSKDKLRIGDTNVK